MRGLACARFLHFALCTAPHAAIAAQTPTIRTFMAESQEPRREPRIEWLDSLGNRPEERRMRAPSEFEMCHSPFGITPPPMRSAFEIGHLAFVIAPPDNSKLTTDNSPPRRTPVHVLSAFEIGHLPFGIVRPPSPILTPDSCRQLSEDCQTGGGRLAMLATFGWRPSCRRSYQTALAILAALATSDPANSKLEARNSKLRLPGPLLSATRRVSRRARGCPVASLSCCPVGNTAPLPPGAPFATIPSCGNSSEGMYA